MAATASLRVLQSKTDGVACLVEVPHALLLAWHSTVSTKADYLECLNKSVPDDAQLSVRIDSSRLANRLAASASRLRTKERGLSGRGKMLLRSGTATFEVRICQVSLLFYHSHGYVYYVGQTGRDCCSEQRCGESSINHCSARGNHHVSPAAAFS